MDWMERENQSLHCHPRPTKDNRKLFHSSNRDQVLPQLEPMSITWLPSMVLQTCSVETFDSELMP